MHTLDSGGERHFDHLPTLCCCGALILFLSLLMKIGNGQHRVVKRRCGAWTGWGMSTVEGNRLKLAQGELLESDEQSTPEVQDGLQGRVAAGSSGTKSHELMREEDDDDMGAKGRDSGVRSDASQSDLEAPVSKGVEYGQAVAGGGEDGANKASDGVEVDWDNVDFSDDDLL